MDGVYALKSLYQKSAVACAFLDLELYTLWANQAAIERCPMMGAKDGFSTLFSVDTVEAVKAFYKKDEGPSLKLIPTLGTDEFVLTKAEDGWILNLPPRSSQPVQEGFRERYDVSTMAVSRHLRAPINDIISTISSLYYNPEILEIRGVSKKLLQINSSSYSLLKTAHLITNYLSYGFGHRNTIFDVFDVRSLVIDAVTNINVVLKSSAVKLTMKIQEEDMYICANRNQIEIMILELLSNAIKACDENGEIVVSAKLKNDKIILTVSDRGWGMSNTVVQKAFAPFYSHSHTGEAYSSMGLGLTICRYIAAINQANIALTSQVDKGTTVAVNFPLQEAPEYMECYASAADTLKDRFSSLYIILSDICNCPNP